MKKQELKAVLETMIKALPRGIVTLPNDKPSDWSVGYYDGLRGSYKMFIEMLDELED